MRTLLLALSIGAVLSAPAAANPAEDAQFIVDQTVTREMFEGALAAQRPVIMGAMQNEMRNAGISLSDPERFFDLFMEEFIDEFTATMRAQSAAIYMENFSDDELADIAAFMRTPSGLAFVSATPALMAEGARMGQAAGMAAGRNAGPRLAVRLREEGIVVTQDDGMMDRLLELLR